MTDRENLIELLMQQHEKLCDDCMRYPVSETAVFIADYLIANGVTFGKDTDVPGKWIPVSEPPEAWRHENGDLVNYLVYMPEYGVDIGNYMKPAKRWICMGIPCEVTHWMPLPEPPKEG